MCSGTVICGGRYVITAKHCINGTTNGADWTITNTSGQTRVGSSFVRVHPTADIAVICLAEKYDSSYDLYCGPTEGIQVCFTGFGRSDPVPGSGEAEYAAGLPRTGYNLLDQRRNGNLLQFDFDLKDGVGVNGLGNTEGTTFSGDSGSGYLTSMGSGYQLVAVHSGILGTVNLDQTVSYGTDVQPYKPWIASACTPEPTTMTLAALGIVGLFACRRR